MGRVGTLNPDFYHYFGAGPAQQNYHPWYWVYKTTGLQVFDPSWGLLVDSLSELSGGGS